MRYFDWLEVFHDVGEASVLYPLAGQKPLIFNEVQEIANFYHESLKNEKGDINDINIGIVVFHLLYN